MDRTANNRLFHGLLARLGKTAVQKQELVACKTNGIYTSSKDLTDHQLAELVVELTNELKDPNSSYQRMVNALYAHARQLGWFASDGKGGVKVDVPRLNAWCQKHTKGHKPIGKMTHKNLVDAVTAIKNLVKTETQRLAK